MKPPQHVRAATPGEGVGWPCEGRARRSLVTLSYSMHSISMGSIGVATATPHDDVRRTNAAAGRHAAAGHDAAADGHPADPDVRKVSPRSLSARQLLSFSLRLELN